MFGPARRSVWALRPKTLEQSTLAVTLRQQVEKFSGDTGITARFFSDSKKHAMPVHVENALLRICQESLTNVQRHAGANQVDVSLVFGKDMVTMSVQDDGAGFDPETPRENRFGLISMRERVRLLGGNLEIKSEKGGGTRLTFRIPLTGG